MEINADFLLGLGGGFMLGILVSSIIVFMIVILGIHFRLKKKEKAII